MRSGSQKSASGTRTARNSSYLIPLSLEDTDKLSSELLQVVVESGALDQFIRKRIENELCVTAGTDQVECELGWDWRLTDSNTE